MPAMPSTRRAISGRACLRPSPAGAADVFTAGDGWWWVPVVAPCVGAILGALAYDLFVVAPSSIRWRRRSSMSRFVLALDQGTTSSRAIVFDRGRLDRVGGTTGVPAALSRPRTRRARSRSDLGDAAANRARGDRASARHRRADIAAIGVTNQRETTVLWERDTGRPVANAIVWQSRITAPICDRLKAAGHEPLFRRKTGLVVDAYFSGTKIKHLLDSHDGLRARAARGEILFGTVDSFLLWRLTGGRRHVTDVSNASRTLLFNIHTLDWDDELLRLLDVPRAMLPEVRSSSEVYGETDADAVRRGDPDRGHRRRSAGRALRPGLLRARHGEEHVRHRLLHAAEHGQPNRCRRRRAC